MPLEPWQAIAISVTRCWPAGSSTTGCAAPIGENTVLLALLVFALILIASVLYTKVFSGRGAFIHVGALVGTIMAFNVFGVIIPNQKKMIAQMIAGRTCRTRATAQIGKQRSVHNNYLTLPVLLMMVSQHYPFLFSASAVVAGRGADHRRGALIRHMLNRVDAGDDWKATAGPMPVAAIRLITAIWITAPRAPTLAAGAVSDVEVLAITAKHCAMCHAQHPASMKASRSRRRTSRSNQCPTRCALRR
jgi:uncharacterized membrane protein